MSLESEIQSAPDKAEELFHESKKHSKLSYTRDFLLSLSELDVCKKLPSGFDQSMLSEFEDASYGPQDRQRIPGSLSSQSYKRTDYSSSPPTRGDSSNYSRGTYGRWDNRSSGRNERDSDSQSDRDSDSGRRYNCNQSWLSGQNPEHDGLLGSGSFPRPSGYVAGSSAPKVRSNEHYQLNRSNEPYHPPRPYKVATHPRRDATDSFNDETFGSTEGTSEDRAEEERKRRESFELMRKEQQKVLQEMQKSNPDKQKDDFFSKLTELLEDTKDGKRVFNRSDELDQSVTQPDSNNDSGKSSLQTPGPRPLVPPGFRSAISERISTNRSFIHSHSTEVGRPEIEGSLSHAKAVVQNGTLDDQQERPSVQKMGFREQQHENMSIHVPSLNKGEQIVDSSTVLEVSKMKLCVDNQLNRTSSLSEASEIQDGSEIVEFDAKKVTGHKIIADSKQDHSTSILEKLFSSALTVNLSVSSEHHDTERENTWSPNAVESSKFAHWFSEDEKKAADRLYARPSDLLSLIVSGEKGGSQVPDMKASKHIPLDLPFQNSELTNTNLTSNVTPSTIEISEKLYNCGKQEPLPAILTCEDLEQTILSEYSENRTLPEHDQGCVTGANIEESKADIDDRASQHLLSLLQKGTGLKDIIQSPNLDSRSSDKLHVPEGAIFGSALYNSKEEKMAENIHHSGNNATLETLFGLAFMKELQSVEAPVSVQRGSVDSARLDTSQPHGLSIGIMDDGLFPTSTVGIGSNWTSHESNVSQSSQRLQSKSDQIENWLGINDTQVKSDPTKRQNDGMPGLGGFDGAVDIQLPEEESLITAGDPVHTPNSIFMSAGNSTKRELLSSNKPVNIAENLVALNTGFKDERPVVGQGGPLFIRGPSDPMEPEIRFRNLHGQPSSPKFHPQMFHGRPFFRPLDLHPTNVSSQMNLLAPERIVHHDAPANHQFPANMLRPTFHHSNTGPAGFDVPPHPMLQQLQMSGNVPRPHLLREFPRGGPLQPRPSNRGTGIQELNPIQGFPFGQLQPNFGGLGMPLQAHDGGGPEAFQRLLEMELRAKSKQIHPLAAVGHSQGMYGHEVDMGFQYR